ncbi:MAG: YdcF family protein [Arenicella sp.]|nr:YdcF family protein [Arenicella sp.]
MDSILLVKIISALSYPLGLLLVLAILRWILRAIGLKGVGSFLGLVGIFILVTASNPLVAHWLVSSLEQQYPQQALSDIAEHDAIVVLGGGLRLPQLPARHTQIGAGSDRYWYATRLYRAGKAAKIVLTGGNLFEQPGYESEAFYAAELLQEWGVPQQAIAIETHSRNTLQNMQNTSSYLKSKQISTILLVTSALHMPRAYNIFKSMPISITPASAGVLVREHVQPQIFDWIPSSAALSMTTVALHEYYGIWFEQLKALIDRG